MTPSDNRFLYYLRFHGKSDNYIINPNESNVTVDKLPDLKHSNATVAYFQSKGIDQKFKRFISTYMGDCIKATNMVKSEFYTINDIPSIVDAYNSCFEQ